MLERRQRNELSEGDLELMLAESDNFDRRLADYVVAEGHEELKNLVFLWQNSVVIRQFFLFLQSAAAASSADFTSKGRRQNGGESLERSQLAGRALVEAIEVGWTLQVGSASRRARGLCASTKGGLPGGDRDGCGRFELDQRHMCCSSGRSDLDQWNMRCSSGRSDLDQRNMCCRSGRSDLAQRNMRCSSGRSDLD